jgi:hypothetical protein
VAVIVSGVVVIADGPCETDSTFVAELKVNPEDAPNAPPLLNCIC